MRSNAATSTTLNFRFRASLSIASRPGRRAFVPLTPTSVKWHDLVTTLCRQLPQVAQLGLDILLGGAYSCVQGAFFIKEAPSGSCSLHIQSNAQYVH